MAATAVIANMGDLLRICARSVLFRYRHLAVSVGENHE